MKDTGRRKKISSKKNEQRYEPEILTVFNRFFSSEMQACLSWYSFQRLSSINPISRPKGVRRLSALSDRSSNRCSERLRGWTKKKEPIKIIKFHE